MDVDIDTGRRVANIESCIRQGGELLDIVPKELESILADDRWRSFKPLMSGPVGYQTFEQFVNAKGPLGLGTTVAMLIDVVGPRNPEALVMLNAALKMKPPGKSSVDIIHRTMPDDGTGRARSLDRLKKNRPDLYEKVKTGEIRSANAAMIQAGLRRRMVQVPIDDVPALARTLKRHLSDEQWRALVAVGEVTP